MKDKIGTTDIKILVDRLDCGEKHGKDTDAMTKKWLTSSKAYLDDVIRKKREMDGYYIHQDSNETHLCELMEWTQDNPYARDLLQTKIALARHYIGRRGFADDFKGLRANMLEYLNNYFFHNYPSLWLTFPFNRNSYTLNCLLCDCDDDFLRDFARIAENNSFDKLLRRGTIDVLKSNNISYYKGGASLRVFALPTICQPSKQQERVEFGNRHYVHVSAGETFFQDQTIPHLKIWSYIKCLQADTHKTYNQLTLFIERAPKSYSFPCVISDQLAFNSIWKTHYFDKDRCGELIERISENVADRISAIADFIAPLDYSINYAGGSPRWIIDNDEKLVLVDGKYVHIEDNNSYCVFLDDTILADRLLQNPRINYANQLEEPILKRRLAVLKDIFQYTCPEYIKSRCLEFLYDNLAIDELSNRRSETPRKSSRPKV